MTGPENDRTNEQSSHEERRPWRTDAQWFELRGRVEASNEQITNVARKSETISHSARKNSWKRYGGALIAASALIAVSVVWQRGSRPETLEWKVATTATGAHAVIELDDSTIITLGPATVLRYAMNASRREIELNGLADFKVTHDAKRPFRVRALNATATDIGTEFVVRAYGGDSVMRVSVTSGEVALVGDSSTKPVTLHAGNVGSVVRSANSSAVAQLEMNSDASMSAAWIAGHLVFENQTLENAAVDLGRWFDVNVKIPNPNLAKRRVSAMYSKPTLVGVLDALSVTVGARYEMHGKAVIFIPAKEN